VSFLLCTVKVRLRFLRDVLIFLAKIERMIRLKKKDFAKRMCALLLVFVLVFGLVPITAAAYDYDGYVYDGYCYDGYCEEPYNNEPYYEDDCDYEREPEEECGYEKDCDYYNCDYDYTYGYECDDHNHDDYECDEYDYEYYNGYDYCEYDCECEAALPEIALPSPALPAPAPRAMPVQTRITPASDEMDYIFISFEGFNLGHGFYIEPMRINIWEMGGVPGGISVRCVTDFAALYVQQYDWDNDYRYCCCFLMLDWDSRGDGSLANVSNHGRQYINLPMFHLYPIENELGGIWHCCFALCCPIGEHQQPMTGFCIPLGWGVTVDHFLSSRDGSDILWGGEVIRWQVSWTVNAPEHGVDVPNDFGVPDFLELNLPFFTHFDKSELIRAVTAYGLPDDVRNYALQVILNPQASPLQIMQMLHWVRQATPDGMPCTRLTSAQAREVILAHNFAPIVQPWLNTGQWSSAGDTRNAGITAVRTAVEELLYDTGITVTGLTPWPNNFVTLPSAVVGGVVPADRVFRATFNDGTTTLTADFTVNIEFLHAEATEIIIGFTMPSRPEVGENSSVQLVADVLPLGIPQAVEWRVEGHSAVSINTQGILTVGEVPLGTQITVTATRIPTVADPNSLYGILVLTVANVVEWAGTGTAFDPFIISNAEELMLLAERANNSPRPANNAGAGAGAFAGIHFLVTNHIQLCDAWPAIGTPFVATSWINPNQHQGTSFEGIFDGGGHTISFAFGSQPLFGAVWHNAVIRNVNIYGPFIAGHGLIAGVAAQFSFGTPAYVLIENVRILSGTVIRGSGFAGTDGFRPQQLDIRNSTVERDVWIGFDASTGEPFNHNLAYFANTAGAGPGVGSFVSGLAGFITNSVSYATVFGHPDVGNIGGLVGYKQQSMRAFEISNSEFHGEVIAPWSNHVGGILGGGYDSPNPRNNTATGQLGGAWAAPNSPGANIFNSTVSGLIVGYDNVGGIVGGEFINQMWSTGSVRLGAQHVVEGNRFEGDVIAMRHGTPRAGAIFGYVRSLNRNNEISDNVYVVDTSVRARMAHMPLIMPTSLSEQAPLRGFGQVSMIDTVHYAPTPFAGTTYFNTQGGAPLGLVAGFNLGDGVAGGRGRANYYRMDDPIGIDLHRLARSESLNIDFVVDRSILGVLLFEARTRVESDYNPIGWAIKRTAYLAAVAVYSNPDATQSQVNGAADELLNALIILRPADEVRWVYLRAVNNTFDQGTVTGEFFPRQRIYIQPGDTVLSVLVDSPLQVVTVGTSLAVSYVVSIEGLAAFDGGPLSGWMYSVNGFFPTFSAGMYTLNHLDEISWEFTVTGGSDLDNDSIIAANRTELNALILQVQGMNPATYTEDTWAFLLMALDWAMYLRDLPRATQSEIDDALATLRMAVNELQRIIRRPSLPGGFPNVGAEVAVTPEGEIVLVTTVENGTATANVVPALIEHMVYEALYNNAAYIVLHIASDEDAFTRKEIALPQASLHALTENNMQLTIVSPIASITKDAQTLQGLARNNRNNAYIMLVAEDVQQALGLTRLQREVVGDNPAIRFSLRIGNTSVTQFAGIVTITLPFTPPEDLCEGDFDLLTVYHINHRAQTREMPGACFYEYAITFTTTHFSLFFISEWINSFQYVIREDWFFRGARFVYTHGLMDDICEAYLLYLHIPVETVQRILGQAFETYCEYYVDMEALVYILYRFANPIEAECEYDHVCDYEYAYGETYEKDCEAPSNNTLAVIMKERLRLLGFVR